ncbi:MAG: hypothetical protein ACK4WD_14550 [Flavobacteriales bacterium]|jgi:hypothetical protein
MKQLLTFILSFALNFSFSQTWESLDGGLECTEPVIVSTILGLNYDEALNRIDAYGILKVTDYVSLIEEWDTGMDQVGHNTLMLVHLVGIDF